MSRHKPLGMFVPSSSSSREALGSIFYIPQPRPVDLHTPCSAEGFPCTRVGRVMQSLSSNEGLRGMQSFTPALHRQDYHVSDALGGETCRGVTSMAHWSDDMCRSQAIQNSVMHSSLVHPMVVQASMQRA